MITTGSRRLRPVAATAVTVLALTGACRAPEPPVLGISTSTPFIQAGRLALEDARAAGIDVPLDTLILPESGSLAGPAIVAAERFATTRGIVAVVGHSNSAASLAAAGIYNDHGVVQIAPTASAVLYSGAGPYSFRMVPPDDGQGRFLAERLEAMRPHGARVAILWVADDYGRGLRAAFREALARPDFPLVLDLPHTEEQEALPDQISHAAEALRAARPDVIVWLARGTVLQQYLPSIRRLGDVPVLGSDGVSATVSRDDADERWRDVHFVDFVGLDATDAGRAFKARFEARFGREPTGADALTYDAVGVLLAGLEAGARSPDEMRDYLSTLGRERPVHPGVTGPVHFADDGSVGRSYVWASIGSGSENPR